MNFKLLPGLSLFGLAMAYITISWDSPRLEQTIWLLITLLSAWLIAKYAERLYFLHGFLVNILNGIWTIYIHTRFLDSYLTHHPKEITLFLNMQAQLKISISQAIALKESTVAVISGIVLGLISVAAARIMITLKEEK